MFFKCIKGISLVALVITIIVLIILTSTVIIVFNNSGIINKSKEAVFKQDFTTILESFSMQKNNLKLQRVLDPSIPDPETIVFSNITNDNIEAVKVYIPIIQQVQNKKINEYDYIDLIQIYNGVIYQVDGINGEVKQWLIDIGIKIKPIFETSSQTIFGFENNGGNIAIYGIKSGTVIYPNIVIPDYIDNKPVTSIKKIDGSPIICKKFESVKIPNTVVRIEQGAFFGCENLKTINISELDELKFIGSQAFQFCKSLKSIELPQGLLEIETYAFDRCTSLKTVTIPNSVTRILRDVFQLCPNLDIIKVNNTKAYCDSHFDFGWNRNWYETEYEGVPQKLFHAVEYTDCKVSSDGIIELK